MPDDSRDMVIEGLLRRLARLQQLLTVTRIMNQTLDLDTLLQYIMEMANDLTRTQASSILLLDAKTGQLRFAASTGTKISDLQDLPVPLDNSIAGQVLAGGGHVMINDVARNPHFYEGIDAQTRFHTRSILGVPLEVKDRRIGVLEVLNKNGDEPFSEDDVEVLTTLAAQSAVAIENARLFVQSDLISDVVHELRTPLTSIIGYSKMLLMNTSMPADLHQQFIATVHREASRLGEMVNGYLDLARLESGRSRLNLQPVDLCQIIQEALQLMRPQADEKSVTLQLLCDNASHILQGDNERIRQVVVNLLGNAIKFNRAGGQVFVALSHAGDSLLLSVQDTGVGMEPAGLPQIFDKFFRGETQEGQTKGTGLGLSIVKQVVEMHGGSISVESAPGVGSTFTVTLPASTP